jgi:type IV secretory pathway VirB9-like protein
MGITISLTKAKDLTKQRLREDRGSLLHDQDILFMKAQESGADTTAIVAEKQRLRDITKDADACTTTDQLKALSVEE